MIQGDKSTAQGWRSTKLDNLKGEDWRDLKDIILFGFGRQGRKIYKTLKGQFHIAALVDNNKEKQGTVFDGHRILSAQEADGILRRYKVIVTTSQYYYQDIREQLSGLGLEENVDFVMYQQFVTEWFYRYRGEIHVLKTDLSLTTKCTLNCENCMQFLPFWKETKENSLEEIREDLASYFKCVDYLLDLDIVGGEPFLYSRLPEFIRLIGEEYRDRIGYVGFITNGMIVPSREALELMEQYDIEVSITDYSENIIYRHKIPELIKALEDHHIAYMRNINIDWFDFGFPKERYHYDGEAAVAHMQCCNSIEHILDKKRLYYCGLQWSAQKGQLFGDERKGYVDLEQLENAGTEERRAILELVMGNIEGGCLQFCKVCGGFGIDNNNRVEAARQRPRGESV